MARLVYRHSDVVIANSQSTVRLVLDLCPDANVVAIHPGVDIASYEPGVANRQAFLKRLGWPESRIVVSTIARMEPRKNHVMVMRAVAALLDEGIDLGYVCGTIGEEQPNLMRLADELRIRDRVYFTGKVSEGQKLQIYGASQIYAMPSIQVGEMIEGFGIVFLEAAAMGVPSVCGLAGGQPEAVLNGRTGIVVDGSDLVRVTEAIRKLACDRALRGAMGRAAVRWARDNDWSLVVERTRRALARESRSTRRG
jgi:phosphatidylinositol alpha-1,6-mannosyltransferase